MQTREQGASGRDEIREEARKRRLTVPEEFLGFLRENKKWWLTPIVLVILVLGVLVFLSGTAAAPFVYTLF